MRSYVLIRFHVFLRFLYLFISYTLRLAFQVFSNGHGFEPLFQVFQPLFAFEREVLCRKCFIASPSGLDPIDREHVEASYADKLVDHRESLQQRSEALNVGLFGQFFAMFTILR